MSNQENTCDRWAELRERSKEKVRQFTRESAWGSNDAPVLEGGVIELKAVSEVKAEQGLSAWKDLREREADRIMQFDIGPTKAFAHLRQPGGIVNHLTAESQEIELPIDHFPMFQCLRAPHGSNDASEDTKPQKIANFVVELLAEVIYMPDETTKERFVELRITMDDYVNKRSSIEMRIPLESYMKLSSKLSAKHPQCIIHNIAAFNENLANMYKCLHERSVGHEVYTYGFGGWIKGPDDRLHFLDSSMENVTSEIYLKWDYNQANKFLPLYLKTSPEKGRLLVLLLFMLWAGLAKFFEELHLSDKGLRALAYVSAPTGTGKTTLVSCMTRAVLREGAKPCLRFEDTEASIEESLVTKRDIPTLVDDFFAQADKNRDGTYRQKASALTRIAGDGLIKSKMGPDRKPLPDRKYRGTIVATGEYLDLNTLSSNLRCWHLDFPAGSIRIDANMAELSENLSITRAYITGWVRYLEDNQETILQEIPKLLSIKENKSKSNLNAGDFNRLGAFASALMVIGHIFYEYNSRFDCCGFTQEEIDKLIIKQAEEQMRQLKTQTPEEIWIRGVKDAVESGALNIAKNEEIFVNQQCDGYFTDGYVCCISSHVDVAVARYATSCGVGIRITPHIKQKLVEKGYLQSFSSKEITFKYTKQRTVSPLRPRLYKIKISN